MGRPYVLEGIVMLHMRRHHAWMLLWRQRVFLDLLTIVFFVVFVVRSATFALEVGGAFVLVRLSILVNRSVTPARSGGIPAYIAISSQSLVDISR